MILTTGFQINHMLRVFALSMVFYPVMAYGQGKLLVVDDLTESRIKRVEQSKGSTVTVEIRNVRLEEAINKVVKLANMRVFYSSRHPNLSDRVSVSAKDEVAVQVVNRLLKGTGLLATLNSTSDGIVIGPTNASDSIVKSKNEKSLDFGTVSGVVRDGESGDVIEGASISVTESNFKAVTDKLGRFSLVGLPPGQVIVVVKRLGYKTSSQKYIIVKGEEIKADIRLNSSATSLNEVVTTATGQQRKVEVANDIVKIIPDEIMARSPVATISDIIEASQTPGVLVQRGGGDPGAPSRIRIRGISSISQSNDPVVIVDGVWVDATVGKLSKLDDIDPASIESIEIVRGASAATLYGQDASNGVIVITTKKGRAGSTRWNFGYNRDWGQTYGRIPFQYTAFGHTTTHSTPTLCPISRIIKFECIQDSLVVYDPNHHLLGREGGKTNDRYIVQLDGGSSSSTYAITASLNSETGVRQLAPIDLIRYDKLSYKPKNKFLNPSKLDRKNISVAYNLFPRSNLTVGLNISSSQSSLRDNSLSNMFWGASASTPDLRYSLDTIKFLVASTNPDGSVLPASSRITTTEKPAKVVSNMLSSIVQYRINSQWNIGATFGVDQNNRNESSINIPTRCTGTNSCVDSTARRTELSSSTSNYTIRTNTTGSINLGWLSRIVELRPGLGGDYRLTSSDRLSIDKDSIPAGYRSLSEGRLQSSNYIDRHNATAGWYLNSTIGILRRIYFDVGVRQDIGSAITSSANSNYPKIGGSWLVSDEGFWRENPLIGMLRLRGALGHSAVQPDVIDLKGKFVNGMGYIDGQFVRIVDPTAAGNSELAPERATEIELGLDVDLFGDRANMILTYAHSENTNVLISRRLPPSAGMQASGSARKENIGKVRNKNLEVSATARAIDTDRMQLSFSYGLTLSENKIVSLGRGVTPFGASLRDGRLVEGYPIASVWATKVLGFKDLNSDGMIELNEIIKSDSSTYVGWSQPRYRASYGVTMNFMGQLTFDTRLAYQSRYVQSFDGGDYGYGSQDVNASLLDQATTLVGGINGKRPISDLRWNSASVTYHLPRKFLNMVNGRSISVSLQGSNLGLWTNYSGRDPGVNSSILTSETSSDNGITSPRPRLFAFSIKLGY